jgi:hypothetical protein
MRNSSQFGSDARASNRRAFFVLREISDVNDLRLHKVAFVRKGVSTYQGHPPCKAVSFLANQALSLVNFAP